MVYAVGIRPATTVWAPGTAPLPPKPWSGRGIRPTRLRREPGNEPVAVKTLAMELPQEAYSTLTWREGTNTDLSSRFAAVRVRPAHRDYLSTRSEEHTSELQSHLNIVCRLLLEKKNRATTDSRRSSANAAMA